MRMLLLSVLLCASPGFADQPPREVYTYLDDPVQLGQANVRFIGLNLYHAQLWTTGESFSYAKPFALILTYKRDFTARELAEMTVKEVARIENTSRDRHLGLNSLANCFADVGHGDRITGVSKGSDQAVFYVNGRKSCDFSYPSFAKQFFGIWLGENTRDPRTRARLLGGSG